MRYLHPPAPSTLVSKVRREGKAASGETDSRPRFSKLTLASLRLGSRVTWRIAASDRSDDTSIERRVTVVLSTDLEIASRTTRSPERSRNRNSSSVPTGREARMGPTLGILGITRTLSDVSRGDRKRFTYKKVSVAEYHSRDWRFGRRWAGLMALNSCHALKDRLGPIQSSYTIRVRIQPAYLLTRCHSEGHGCLLKSYQNQISTSQRVSSNINGFIQSTTCRYLIPGSPRFR